MTTDFLRLCRTPTVEATRFPERDLKVQCLAEEIPVGLDVVKSRMSVLSVRRAVIPGLFDRASRMVRQMNRTPQFLSHPHSVMGTPSYSM
ncbi:MAG: hypothetical protein ACYDAM_01340 [Leptospirales bacterium]